MIVSGGTLINNGVTSDQYIGESVSTFGEGLYPQIGYSLQVDAGASFQASPADIVPVNQLNGAGSLALRASQSCTSCGLDVRGGGIFSGVISGNSSNVGILVNSDLELSGVNTFPGKLAISNGRPGAGSGGGRLIITNEQVIPNISSLEFFGTNTPTADPSVLRVTENLILATPVVLNGMATIDISNTSETSFSGPISTGLSPVTDGLVKQGTAHSLFRERTTIPEQQKYKKVS